MVNLHSPTPARESLRQRQRLATRAAILDAAETVFSQAGPGRGRMESVAQRAGVSVGTLYNHFEDRAALLAALHENRRAALVASIDAAIASAPAGPGRLETFLAAMVAHVRSHRRLLLLMQEQPLRFAPGRRGLAGSPTPTLRALGARAQRLLADGQREGWVAPQRDPALLAAALLGMARALLVRDLNQPGPPSALEAAAIARLFLEGAGR
jgi:AcrR family transcriptional regulator